MKRYLLPLMLFSVLGVSAQTVYISKSSYVYHNENCEKVNSKYYPVSLKIALEAGSKPCKVCSPPTNVVNEKGGTPLEFTKVIYTDSVGKDKIYVTINDWFASNFKSANDVIQMADKDAGVIIGKGAIGYSYGKFSYIGFDGQINFTIKVYIKDNRYKVEIINIYHERTNYDYSTSYSLGTITNDEDFPISRLSGNFYNNAWKDIKEKITLKVEMLFNSLELKTKNVKTIIDKDGW